MTKLKFLLSIALLASLHSECGAQSTVKLKGTGYKLSLPKYFTIEKKQGTDYETFYVLSKKQSACFKTFVMFGCCVGNIGETGKDIKRIDSVHKVVLGHEALWTIYSWDSCYLAETLVRIDNHNKAAFGIRTNDKEEISLLISAFCTLRKRD